jgi:sulfate adenylyltransferase
MIQPHGGKLIDRVLHGDAKRAALESAKGLPAVALDADALSDVENMATGVFSPLEGYMGQDDYRHVLDHMRLANDLAWTIPIVLDVPQAVADGLKPGSDVLLTSQAGEPAAILQLEEK